MTDWDRYPHFDLDYHAHDEAWHRRMEQRELALDAAWELRLELPGERPAPALTVSWLDRRGAEGPEGPERREVPVKSKPAVMDKRQLMSAPWIATAEHPDDLRFLPSMTTDVTLSSRGRTIIIDAE